MSKSNSRHTPRGYKNARKIAGSGLLMHKKSKSPSKTKVQVKSVVPRKKKSSKDKSLNSSSSEFKASGKGAASLKKHTPSKKLFNSFPEINIGVDRLRNFECLPSDDRHRLVLDYICAYRTLDSSIFMLMHSEGSLFKKVRQLVKEKGIEDFWADFKKLKQLEKEGKLENKPALKKNCHKGAKQNKRPANKFDPSGAKFSSKFKPTGESFASFLEKRANPKQKTKPRPYVHIYQGGAADGNSR